MQHEQKTACIVYTYRCALQFYIYKTQCTGFKSLEALLCKTSHFQNLTGKPAKEWHACN